MHVEKLHFRLMFGQWCRLTRNHVLSSIVCLVQEQVVPLRVGMFLNFLNGFGHILRVSMLSLVIFLLDLAQIQFYLQLQPSPSMPKKSECVMLQVR